MSSWLGGIGSGLGQSLGQVGGSLSSFTGQISNFTKDMLLEGVEEVGDAATELQLSNSKLADVEATLSSQKFECERLKKLHAELEEKLEAAEIQNKQQSAEYRKLLQQKDVEISHLKARQSGLQEEVQNLQSSVQSASAAPVLPVTLASSSVVTTATSFLSQSSASHHHHGFHGDDMDLSEVISSQQEINRLAAEVLRLEAEVAHWRRMSQASTSAGAGNSDQSDVLKLQRTVKELRDKISHEVDEHQHELAALQDAQRQKISDLSRRHREELAEYEERIEELEEQLQNGSSPGSSPTSSPSNPSKELELQTTVATLRQAAEEREAHLSELSADLEEAQRLRASLQSERDDAQEENAALLQNYARLQASVDELQGRVREQEGKAVQKAQLEHEIQVLRDNLATAEKETEQLKSLREAEPEEVEHADILELNTVIGTLREEKEALEQEKLTLQQKLSAAEEKIDSAARPAETESTEDLKEALERLERTLKATQEERDTLLTELEELDRQNQDATQHLISMKEQLKKAETEHSATKDRTRWLEQELEAQKEKTSQSAFTLNDLHMSKQQLESAVRDLKDKLKQAQEHNKEARREMSELKKSLQEKEQHLLAAKQELSQTLRRKPDDAELGVKERELSDLRRELEKVTSQDFELKMENSKLKEAVRKTEDSLKENQTATSRTLLEKDTRIEALKLEKEQLERELQRTERSLAEGAKQYQRTVDELSRAHSMDASALQKEHERAVKLNQVKDTEIAQLRLDAEQMAADHRDTNEMLAITVAGQKQLTDLLEEKDEFAETLKRNAADERAELETSVAAARREADALRQALEEKDRQLAGMKEDNSHLKEEMDRVQDQQSRSPRTLDIITELEAEITQLKSSRGGLEEEMRDLRQRLEEQQVSLLSSRSELERAALDFDRLLQARDQELAGLRRTLESRGPAESPMEQGDIILQEDKTVSLNQENGNEKHDLSKVELERLVKGMKEKETEISQLNEKNLSLTRQLDQMALSRDEVGKLSQVILQKDLEIQALHARVTMGGGGQDVLFLQQQLQAYAVEREQVLAVLNEKTRENSQLRSDYHRLMDIVSGKEAALLKLQQENQRLYNAGDPSGSQEMFKETIQNLSRIIREKDIEIDALTQKCQTLVTVLQSSGGDGGGGVVSSNQFEELLKERDTLKQQVKKMEEWKQQVITTVKNMQHESAQLQEELINLQARVTADGDAGSQLSVDYARLVQSYEQKEQRLGSLSVELAQVQQTLSQLSTTKDLLLGRLDHAAPESTAQSSAVDGASQDLTSLQARLAERENLIRTLQENNHRLSCSASTSESDQKNHAAELQQVRASLEALQRSVRDKDLLIKTKGDQLSRLGETLRNRESDNEVLKQAVTNLKERALILELDGKTLKEENERVAGRSREKESEFRALQETNMQVSMLLREREFELNAMRDKATTVEKMLKDKEQGKSSELNQLLNEIKSMQDKAVAFQHERDQVMMALKQKQMETTALQTELQHVRDKEQRLNLELERLRNHLLEIEDSYTREALAAEDRETELRRRVALLDERLATSSSAVESASQQASMQVESLQEQLSGVLKQRDDALLKLGTSQEQVKQYAVSLSNLQMVLEQFQQEEKAMYSTELDKLRKEKEEWRKKADKLEDQASALQMNLDEANAALDSASRLTDQLDYKEEQIEELKQQVDVRQEMLEEAQKKLMNLLNSTEGKIDKALMRNLLQGYFHTPKKKRMDVLRLMGSVLGLSPEDVDKMLDEDTARGVSGWVSSWLGGRGPQSVPNTPQRPTSGQSFNTSFSEMFVKFLEIESRPSLPPPKLPIMDIKPLSAPPSRKTQTSGAAPGKTSNPFLAPRSAAVPLLGTGAAHSGGPGGHLLMKSISDTLPTFTPVPVSAEASGGAVLKDLLNQ
ncbi:thyroid receptor-interacting protein 11 isoform X1 [Syngnathus typhle]|uniref:thyroid receptor-interacting protein 11 isoform X1 n=1 Tax=Syngnathus typhle TaxID=161592 RepID=UPI002A6AED17|nr:thyroid receptor-interacting protein 11 isoform X1 [Syngnathus typhle]